MKMFRTAIAAAAILIITGLVNSTNAATQSSTQASITYSPYVDMTINVHWDPKYQDLEPMDLVAVSAASGVKNYHLAFVADSRECAPSWGGTQDYPINQTKTWGSHLTDALHEKGLNFSVAFGGAVGVDLSRSCSLQQLITIYEQIISVYKPDSFDFDIENPTVNLDKLIRAIQETLTKHPNLKISFTLPVLPTGLVDQGIQVVKAAQAGNLKFTVNLMAMDYGVATCSGHMDQCAIDSATSVHKFLKTLYPSKTDAAVWQMIEITPMIGVNDVGGEQFTLDNTTAVKSFAERFNVNGLAMWSIARDNPCPDKAASPICSGNNLQTKSYEFSQRFLR